MANTAPDVRVRLSAEGVKEVVDALKNIADEANKQGKRSEGAFSGLVNSLGGIRGLISKLTVSISALSFANLAKDAIDYADSVGKAAVKSGSLAEGLSVLRVGASTADVEAEELDKSLIKLSVNMEALRQGSQKQVDAFAQLGLKAKDFVGLSTDQAFEKIALKLGGIEDSSRKTAIAVELFGNSGATLIPLLNDIAENGMEPLKKKAEELGLVVDEQTALLAANVNDSFTDIKSEVKGLTLQFVSGLLPAVKQTMDEFKDSTQGEGVSSMKKFGEETGRVLRVLVATFKLFANVVTGVFKSVGDGIGAIAAAGAAIFRGDFVEAATIIKERFIQEFTDIKNIGAQVAKDFKNVVDTALSEPVPVTVDVQVKKTGAFEDVETDAERKARQKAEREAERARKEAQRQAEKDAREREAAAKRLADFQTKLLSSEDQRHAAFENNLAKEVTELNKLFDTLKIGDDERIAFLDRYQASQRAAFNLDELKNSFEQTMQSLDDARKRIELNAQAGLISQTAAVEQIRQLEASRLPGLQELAKLLEAQAQAIGPDAVAGVQKYVLAIQELAAAQKQAAGSVAQFQSTAFDAFNTGLADTLKNLDQFESVGDAVKAVFRKIAQSIADLAAEILAKQATLALIRAFGASAGGFSEGGAVGSFADGGAVGGIGTGRSDSNLAWLSRGEFVVREAVVSQPGMLEFLHALNGGTPRARGPVRMPRFADGGLNTGAAPKSQGGEGRGIRIVNVTDPAQAVNAMSSAAGERVVLNHIEANATGIRRMLLG